MSVIVAGDNGTELFITVSDDDGFVDLTSATSIVANFLRGDKSKFSKSLTVTDALAGECKAELSSDDLIVAGTYKFQITVSFSGGNEFSSNQYSFVVLSKISI